MKKVMVGIGSIVSLICILMLSACDWFSDGQLDSNVNTETNEENYGQYFIEECPISFTEKSVILPNNSDMQLMFMNSSGKKIIAYEAIYILYNVYDEQLISIWNTSPYHKIAETPQSFGAGKTDLQYYSVNSAVYYSEVYYSEVYIYYVLFDDQTSWGYRTNISTDTILKFGTKYKIERA